MASLLMVLCIVVGLVLLPTWPLAGVAIAVIGFKLQRFAEHDEDFLEGLLGSLAALGVVAEVAQGLWLEFIARP